MPSDGLSQVVTPDEGERRADDDLQIFQFCRECDRSEGACHRDGAQFAGLGCVLGSKQVLGGSDQSSVTHTHDALGNTVSTNADGSVTTIAHDVRGRKTSMVDPNMGTWEHRYNVFGELIWQKDAKLQVTTMTYDPLGRMKTRSSRCPREQGSFPQRTITDVRFGGHGQGQDRQRAG
ncbi:MAG: hypothetical protein HS122_06315 [Opitutaceae bacterium]|nr:hypothetical protein [Opitutaceae bacterium]